MVRRFVAPVMALVALLSLMAFVMVTGVGAQTSTPGAGTTTTGTGTARAGTGTSTTGTSTTGTVAATATRAATATTAPTATKAASSAAASSSAVATGTGGATLPATGQPQQRSSSALGVFFIVLAATAAVIAGFAFRKRSARL